MKELIFKGFHEDENGTQELYTESGVVIKGEWIIGGSIMQMFSEDESVVYIPQKGAPTICCFEDSTNSVLTELNSRFYKVIPETVSLCGDSDVIEVGNGRNYDVVPKQQGRGEQSI